MIQKDPDDNKFVDCAITAGARYIVTEDHHYDVIKWKDFPGLDVVGLDEFLKHLLKIIFKRILKLSFENLPLKIFMPLFRFPFKRTDSREQKPQGRRGKPPSGADFSTSPSLLQGELHILTKPQ